MGRQINFYLTPTDTQELERFLRIREPLCVLHSRSPVNEPQVLQTTDLIQGGKQWLFFKLVRSTDIDQVLMEYVPAQGYWTIDELRSPVIEFNRCYIDDQALRRGRLYYTEKFYGADGAVVEKPEEFRAWAQALFRSTKKYLKKKDVDYFGPEAEHLIALGQRKIVQ